MNAALVALTATFALAMTTLAALGPPARTHPIPVPRRDIVRLRRAWPPWAARVATLVGLFVVVVGFGPIVLASVVIARPLSRKVRTMRATRRRTLTIAQAYPDFVDLLVLTIHAGRTPSQAMRSLLAILPEPIRSAVQAVLAEVDRGIRFEDALAGLTVTLGSIGQPVVDALTLSLRAGVPLATTLDQLAADAHDRRRRAADASARQIPVRLSFPLVGCTLPSFVLLAIVPLMAGSLSTLGRLSP